MAPTTNQTSLTFPPGNIGANRPGSTQNPYGFPWAGVARWEPMFTQAGGEAHVPPQLVAAMAIVESDANHTWPSGNNAGQVIEVWDNFPQDGPSVGIMQMPTPLKEIFGSAPG